VTTSERQQVEGYLAWKWGLNSQLPGGPLNPLWQSGLALWLDAADSSTVSFSSGSNIASWNDKSGNRRNAIQYNTGFANYDSANKRTVITPTGQLYAPVPAGTFSAGVTGFVVFQKYGANSATVDALISRTSGGYPAPFDMYQTGSSTARLVGTGPTTNYRQYTTSSDSLFQSTTMTLYNFSVASSLTWTESRNGNFQTVTGTIANAGTPVYGDTATSIQIGTRDDKYPTANVYIYEIILFNGTFTPSQRQGVEGYLAAKWGLTVPTSTPHPFFRLPASSVAQFSPTMISGCTLWLDAADASTITGTTSVTSWADKSTTGRTVTFSGTSVYDTANRNIYTDGSSFFYANVDSRKTTVPNLSVFVVYKALAYNSGTNQAIWGQDVAGGWNRLQLLNFPASTANNYGLAYTGSSPNTTNATGLNNSNQLLYNGVYSYGVTNATGIYVNGAAASTFVTEAAALTQTSTTNTYFTTSSDASFPTPLAINEIIMYNAALTSTQRQQIEGYLSKKWSISLPTTHPYYKFAPAAI
jgi:hypothetical protein